MADGSVKRLRDVNVGDEVLSWDDALMVPAVSSVKAIPKFARRREEMVRIYLPKASLVATQDHPFWSRGRSALVSSHPTETKSHYGLDAQMLEVGEELDGVRQQPVPVVGISRSTSLRSLQDSDLAESDESNEALDEVEVMTLGLKPFHWFYVHGVRVHNKGGTGGGCFAPWTPIRMAGQHIEKPISEVQVGDKVLSWDHVNAKLAEATVIGIETVPPTSLMQLLLSETETASTLIQNDGYFHISDARSQTSLVLTRDHPIFSVRTQGIVSMDPGNTSSRYGIPVSQMLNQEFLLHYEGHHVTAKVQDWQGTVPLVMTLHLDQYHWFFAQGVLVHNKGGYSSVGSSGANYGGSGYRGGGGSSLLTLAAFATAGAYVGYVIAHSGSRRRYGTYEQAQDASCTLTDTVSINSACSEDIAYGTPPPGFQPQATVSAQDCASVPISSLNAGCCYQCISCETQSCVDRISGCESFLTDITPGCSQNGSTSTSASSNSGLSGGAIAGIVIGVLVACCCLCFCCWLAFKAAAAYSKAAQRRRQMEMARLSMKGSRGRLPEYFHMVGTYTELGETKPCQYELHISDAGIISGTGGDDDGQAIVQGVVNGAEICWRETRPSVEMEVKGTVKYEEAGFQVYARYVSSYEDTEGFLNLNYVCPLGFAETPFQEVPMLGRPGGMSKGMWAACKGVPALA